MNIRQLLRRTALAAAVIIGVPALAAGGWAGYLQLVGNIHAVDPGALYRSAQLNGDDLKDVLAEHHIKSVINLRGDNPGNDWYDDEIKVTAEQGAAHFDVGMGATSEPEPDVTARLIHLLKTAPRPILVHCASGADRTGLAAALYAHLVEGMPARQAAQQLSFRYGHFPWLGSRTVAMDRAFWKVVGGESISHPN